MYRIFEQLKDNIPNLDELQDGTHSQQEINHDFSAEQEALPMETTTSSSQSARESTRGVTAPSTLSRNQREQSSRMNGARSEDRAMHGNGATLPKETSRSVREAPQATGGRGGGGGAAATGGQEEPEEDPFLADLEAAGVRYDKDQLRAPKSHTPSPPENKSSSAPQKQYHPTQDATTKHESSNTVEGQRSTPVGNSQPWSPARPTTERSRDSVSAGAATEAPGNNSTENKDFSTAVSSWFSRVSTPLRNIESPNTEVMQQRISSTFRKAWTSISNVARSESSSEENRNLLSNGGSSHGKGEDAEVVSGSSLGLGGSGLQGRHPGDSCLANTMWTCWPLCTKIHRGYKMCVDSTKCGCLIQMLVRAVVCLVTSTIWVFKQCFKGCCPGPVVEKVEGAYSYVSEKAWAITVKQGIAIVFVISVIMLVWLTHESLWTMDAGMPRMKISRAPAGGD